MIMQANHAVGVLEPPNKVAAAAEQDPSYRVCWTPQQRLLRWLTRPLVWLQGRIYRRFLQLFAPAVAFWLCELPIVFSAMAVLVRLRVFDRLEDGPQSVDDLATATGADQASLLRVLRTVATLGFLKRERDGRFSLRPVGRQFLQNSPNPVAAWTELLDKLVVPSLDHMTDAVIRGQSPAKIMHNKTCWELMADVPGTTELHDRACGGWTEHVVDQVAQAYDFSQIKTVIDVGGGRGAFLCAMLKAAPHLHGRVFDRETTKVAAQGRFVRMGVADRAAHECGNFFEEVPAGADLYTIKHALHDWDDESAVRILKTIRRAIPPHGKLLIVEGSVDHDLLPAPSVRAIWDLTQFVVTWGKSRTLDEFAALAHQAGFRLAQIYVPATIDALILECLPVENEH